MNPAEQRARFTAVSRAEKRLDDVELCLTSLAAEIVKDRENLDKQHAELIAGVNDAFAGTRGECAERVYALAAVFNDFTLRRTFWQRLRWLVRGV